MFSVSQIVIITNFQMLSFYRESVHVHIYRELTVQATCYMYNSLRKHAYSNTLKNLQPKMAIFQIKNSDVFHISAQNIDCGYSLEPPLVEAVLTSTHNLWF